MQNTDGKSNFNKDAFLQNLKIVLWGVLALLLAVLTVLELFTAGTAELGVGEAIKVSSSLIHVGEGRYTSAISGSIKNSGAKAVRIEAVRVTVSDGEESREIELDGFVLPARYEREIGTVWQGTENFNRVTRVSITVDGTEDVLPNTAAEMPVSGIAIFYLALLLVDVLLLVRAVKIRYYIYQETQMPIEGDRKC